MTKHNLTPEERFWSNVKKTRKCWLWKGSKTSQGYGQITVDSKTIPAHRYSWELHNGGILEGLFVLHTCDNKGCVNPAHLFLGTAQDNMNDKYEKGRENMYMKGEYNPNSKLTWKEVRAIRKYYKSKYGNKTQQQIADHFGMSKATIVSIIYNKTWRE